MCIGSGFFSASYGARHSALSVGLLDEAVLPKEETSILGVLSPQMFSKFFREHLWFSIPVEILLFPLVFDNQWK